MKIILIVRYLSKKILFPKVLFFAIIFLIPSCVSKTSYLVISDVKFLEQTCNNILKQEKFNVIFSEKNLIETDWKIQLSSYSKKGKREKVFILFKEHSAKIELEVIVKSELNYASQDYLSTRQSLWLNNGRNKSVEKWLLSLIKNKILLK